MADINIKRYNGDTWEIHYPKTTIGQVINLSSQLANMQSDIDGKVGLAGNETITGIKTFVDISGLKINFPTNKIITTPDFQSPFQSPIAKYLYHDLYAFCRVATPVYEVSADNVNWTPATLSKIPFDQKNMTAVTVLDKASNIVGARWTWNSGSLEYSLGQWLVIGTAWVSDSAVQTYLFETSTDGINWTQRFLNSVTLNANNAWLYISGTGADSYHRLTITIPVDSASNTQYRINSIKLLSARWGDQGLGSEYEFPYTWDENMNIQSLGELREGSARVYSSNNKPTPAAIGAYPATNPNGYITSSGSITGNAATATKLAAPVNINGVAFDGSANITVADSTKMPISGGTFTGDITLNTIPGSTTQNSKNLIFEYNGGALGGGVAEKAMYVDKDGTLRFGGAELSKVGHTHTKAQITDFAHTHTKAQITDFAHTHTRSEITDFAHEHEVEDIANFTGEVLAISPPWKPIMTTQIAIPTTLTANNVTVESGNYYNKILAFEVRVGTGTDSYETHIVFGRMGSNSTTSVSDMYDRFYSWSSFDGRYFKTHSFKAYVSNSVSTQITVGAIKHLIGSFSGSSIAWTTNTTTSTYLERIWLVN